MSNQLPKGWKTDKLGNRSVILRGSTITKSQVTHGGYPVVAGGKEAAYYHNAYNREAPIITVSGSGASAGYVNFWQTPIFASDCSTVAEKDVNIKYLYYFLKSKQQEILDKQVGVAIPHVSPKDIIPLVLTYPEDKEEQKYIVDTLDMVAEAIRLRKDTIEKTKELIPAIFSQMFGDPNIVGENFIPFNQFYDIVNNEKKEIKTDEYLKFEEGFLPVVDQGQKDVVGYTNQLDKRIYASINPVIIFGDHTREIKYIDFDFVIGADGTQLLRPKKEIKSLFAYWQLKLKEIENKGYSRHFKYVKEMSFMSPPLPLQEEFARKVEEINKYLEYQQAELNYFEELFQSLLQDAFTGKLTWNFPRGGK